MSPAHHPKAAAFVRQNLFAGVTTFAEFEARIVALPDEQSRGDAFEVFAEAYLATQRKHDAAQVWPLASVPTKTFQTLGLASQDYGVDGVFQTLLGHFNAYQVKFRSQRPALTWRELSTFMGLADSPHLRSRVLLTNCDDLPSVLNERQGFFCIRGSDLDRLEADDFRAIEAWLADTAFIAPKKHPLPHQIEGLDALLPALETHDRVSAIMACASGKTLLALWIAERRQAALILVLVPSLALLRQILHEWLRETSLPSLAYLCVCSDLTVKQGLDSLSTAQSDLDFQVSTEAASVRGFLDAPFTGTKIIFSTYQSAQTVGTALKPGETFDLGVFDEAHKTAGREGRNFGFALEDANLPIRKRLFLTATPRHYNPLQRDAEGDAQLVFSMDNPAFYGPQAYCLTFAEAARRGIICRYKVIISVITSEMVTNELLSRGAVFVNGDAVRARQVANQLALKDAIAQCGANRVFTFHSRVDAAASFTATGSEGISTHLPEFKSFHVNGDMLTTQRERIMRDFRASPQAIMSNARCLTEGVDVPVVDMVAFMSPRRSKIDIIQATGRAMRVSPGKKTGFVLVPLYVEQAGGETIEQAIQRAEFDEIWQVLQSLQEQDDVLAETISLLRETRGRGAGFNDAAFRDQVDILGPTICLEVLRSAITTKCADVLGSTWDERLGQLKAFQERTGHLHVDTDWQLHKWVRRQRWLKRNGTLTDDRTRRLNGIGFKWYFSLSERNWDIMFAELRAFKNLHGHCDPKKQPAGFNVLMAWLGDQHQKFGRNELASDRVEKLRQLGVTFEAPDATPHKPWDTMSFARLLAYKEQFGDCDVTRHSYKFVGLGRWVDRQRERRAAGKLEIAFVDSLNDIGFIWDRKEYVWRKMYLALCRLLESSGASMELALLNNEALNMWIQEQQSAKQRGTLDQQKQLELDRLGFPWATWDRKDFLWRKMYLALCRLLESPGASMELALLNDEALNKWIQEQQSAKQSGALDQQKQLELDRLAFPWATWDRKELFWRKMYLALCRLLDSSAPQSLNVALLSDAELSKWVREQQSAKRRGVLDQQKQSELDKIGFPWESRTRPKELLKATWDDMFTRLADFHRLHGHWDIKNVLPFDEQLHKWAQEQRYWKPRRLSSLSEGPIHKLAALGFIWDAKELLWDRMFKLLVAYKSAHGDCNVPCHWHNYELSNWVAFQRKQRNLGKMMRSHIKMLNQIGFLWGNT